MVNADNMAAITYSRRAQIGRGKTTFHPDFKGYIGLTPFSQMVQESVVIPAFRIAWDSFEFEVVYWLLAQFD